MWQQLLIGLCLVLVVEGMLPFVSPTLWRKMAFQVAQMNDRSMRVMGLASMLIGVTLLYWIN